MLILVGLQSFFKGMDLFVQLLDAIGLATFTVVGVIVAVRTV